MMDPSAPEQKTNGTQADLESLVADLSALAHLHRVRLLQGLTEPRYGEELGELLGTTRQNALKHVQQLEDRGFVRRLDGQRASGPVVEYQVVPKRLFALTVALSELCRLEPRGGPQRRRDEPTMDDPSPPGNDVGEPFSLGARLLVLNGPASGRSLELGPDRNRLTVGRDKDRDLALAADPFVSSHHAEVHATVNGHSLVDVFSANGTFHNFKRLPKGGRVPLRVGDVVGIGRTQLVYQEAEPVDASN